MSNADGDASDADPAADSDGAEMAISALPRSGVKDRRPWSLGALSMRRLSAALAGQRKGWGSRRC